MGIHLSVAIARVDGDEAEHVVKTARAMTLSAQRFREPFSGVMAGVDLDDEHDLDELELTFDRLFAAFPALAFAVVDVDCFGGVCMYGGHVERGGEQIGHVRHAHDGHQQLFALLGVPDAPWYFVGFTRDFLATGGEPAGERRREVLCHARATFTDVFIAPATIAVAALGPPWQITIANERTLIVDAGDLWLSLNARGDTVELAASSHVDRARTAEMLVELCDALGTDTPVEITSTSSRGA